MNSSITWITTSPEPTFARDATCAGCHHRGTVGFVARGSGVPNVQARYCFRCWPGARRAASTRWADEAAAAQAAFLAWAEGGGLASGQPEPTGVSGQVLQEHWRGTVGRLLARVGLVRARPVLDPPAA